ncbi:hypothetical protein QYE76_066063 [Lolium multiflorum]|uniref:Uncharacterized protein n=1 Tax=Lolium multiflorum TaxID=4521 RepID=A0AAD8W9G3_LOLMU|nr:hypothetical protein QYE76_066063 [Lolium multiflorum]
MIRREAITPRKINFATPTDHQPLTNPKENMKKAAEILTKKDEEIDINHLRTLVASAMKQQSKADTSRRLESNPEHCVSTAQKESPGRQHRDDESRTGSTERRRRTREHPNPIPVPSETPPMDPKKGKGPMYTGKDKYRNPSPPPLIPRTRSARRNPAGAGTKNVSPSPAEAGTTEATVTKEKVATKVGVSRRKDTGNPKAEAKYLPPHHPVEEVEAEAGDPAPAQSPFAMSCVMPGNVSTSTDLNTLAQSASNAFNKHFRGTYKRPATTSDLQACIQKKGETSRSFLTRWLATKIECEHVENRTAMHAFTGGLQRGGLLRHRLTCLIKENNLKLDGMITIASNHTAADDDAGGDLAATAIPLHQQKKNRDNVGNNNNKRKNPSDDQKSGGSDMVAMTFQRGGQGGGRGRGRGGGAGRGQQRADEVTIAGTRAPQTYEEYRDMPCLAHIDPATGKSSHTNRNCKWVNDLKTNPEAGYKQARKHRPRGKGGNGKNKEKDEDSSEAMDEDEASSDPKEGSAANKSNPFVKKSAGAYHTFLGTPTVRAKKSALRILNATVPAVPQYVKSSENPCTFDRADHPAIIPKECYALVVSPRIDEYDFSKCLMDGGASLNIMYLET